MASSHQLAPFAADLGPNTKGAQIGALAWARAEGPPLLAVAANSGEVALVNEEGRVDERGGGGGAAASSATSRIRRCAR